MLNTWRNLFQHDGYRPTEVEDSLALRVLTFLTVSVAIMATIQATESALSLGMSAVLLSALGSFLSWRRRRAKNWWIKLMLAMMMLAALANFFYGLRENIYDARIPLAHLLIWLQTLHSYDLPRRKDVFYSLWVGLILMSVAATTSRSNSFGLFLAVFSLLAVSSLLASHLSSQKASPRLLKRLSWPVLGGGMVLGALIFFSMPRYEGMKIRTYPVSMALENLPQFDGKIKNPAYDQVGQNSIDENSSNARKPFDPFAYYGFSTELDLNYRGRLSDEVVMKVRGSRASYWRGMGFDTYNGLRWTMTEPFELKRIESRRQPLWVRESRNLKKNIVPREMVTHSFYIERDQSNLIFKAPYAEQLYFPTDYVLMDNYGGIRSPIELFSGTTYTVISAVPRFSETRLRTVSWQDIKDQAIGGNYTQIPHQFPERIGELARRITAQADSPYTAVKLLEEHLKTQYPYNLDIPMFPEDRDAIDYFLFEQKEGYCEHFASALAMMARSLGLPTRFVTGYTAGQYNPLTGYFEVRSSDAHGWVEVHFPNHGWVPFDPTPGYLADLRPNNMNNRSSAGNFWDYLMKWMPDGVKKAFRYAIEKSLGAVLSVFGVLVTALTWLPLPAMLSLIGGLMLCLLAWVFWRSRSQKTKAEALAFAPAYRQSPTRAAFVQTYLSQLQQFSQRTGQANTLALTPTEQALAAGAHLNPSEQQQLQHWNTRYQAVRYGDQEPSAAELNALKAFFAALPVPEVAPTEVSTP